MLMESKGRGHQLGIRRGPKLRGGELLAGVGIQLRAVIERIDVRNAAGQEDKDELLRPRGMVCRLRRERDAPRPYSPRKIRPGKGPASRRPKRSSVWQSRVGGKDVQSRQAN
jgi:hypothetical protein